MNKTNPEPRSSKASVVTEQWIEMQIEILNEPTWVPQTVALYTDSNETPPVTTSMVLGPIKPYG